MLGTLRRIKGYWPLLLLVGIVLITVLLWQRQIRPRLPVAPARYALAEAGVSHNAEWTPTIVIRHGALMALVPAGCYQMGSSRAQLVEAQTSCDAYFGFYGCQEDFQIETPDHEVCFDLPFWIDVLEISNRAYGSSSSVDDARSGRWPREGVTWDDARLYCEKRLARLPTEAEWEYAAGGPDGLIYPWGNTFNGMYQDKSLLYPFNVGTTPEADSWVGAADLGGGVSEWVADWYGDYASNAEVNPGGPETGTERVIRGGNWFSFASYFLRTSYRDSQPPDYASAVLGFRCASGY